MATQPLSRTALPLGGVRSSSLEDASGVVQLFFKALHNSAFVAKNNVALLS